MKIYSVEIKFEKEKHCLRCPLRYHTTDMCDIQKDEDNCYIEFENWEEQMKNCPLREVLEELGEKCVACGKYTGEVNVKVCSKCASEYRF